ncbi:fibronectin type III domain-containing protein [Cellulomonas rhizosphaerae]|nr:fibronectin type III domain-containing protein [Cellulomonas rhizosphaerae]
MSISPRVQTRRATLVALLAVLALVGWGMAPTQAAAPSRVAGVSATAIGATSLRVAWRAVAGASSYVVSVSTKPGLSAPKKVRTAATSAKVSGLKKDTRYYVAVQAKFGSHAGARSTVESVRTWKTRPAGPTGVRLATNSVGKFEVAWKRVAKHATSYQVVVATDKALKHVVFRTGLTTKTHKWVLSSKIKEHQRYYFAVRAFNTKSTPGRLSTVRSVRPHAHQAKTPANVTVRPASSSSVQVSWSKADWATGYTVSVSRTKGGTAFWSQRVAGTSLTVPGMPRGVSYVTVTSDRLKATFAPAKPVPASPREPTPAGTKMFSTTIGSYNVLKDSAERPFYKRVPAIVTLMRSMDVAGVQEVTYGAVSKHDGGSSTYRPVELLAAKSGLKLGTYDPRTKVRCSANSVHVLYDDAKFDLVACGSAKYAVGESRYWAWDRLADSATGQQLVVVSTHLTNGKTVADDRTRAAQGAQLAGWLATLGDVPVVVTGDLNSYYGVTADTPMARILSAGYYPADLTAPSIVGGQYASTHAWQPTRTTAARIDHVLTSRAVVASRFGVERVKESTAPSDHHPVWATVSVYS